MAQLIRPANAQGRAFLVYGNYDVLLKWNSAHSFAIAVGTLADRLRQ
jgi:membrane-bound lytic murein transglycosylase B